MFNVFQVKPYSSVRRQPSATRRDETSQSSVARPGPSPSTSASTPLHQGPRTDITASSSPAPKAPPAMTPHAAPRADSAKPRTVPTAVTRPQASSLPTTTTTTRALPALPAHEPVTTTTSAEAAARSRLPRRTPTTSADHGVSRNVPASARASAQATPAGPRHQTRGMGEDEPMPSAPPSQLPSHVRRLSGERRSPSGGPASANPYTSVGPVARASVIPPGGTPPRAVAPPKPQQQQQPPPQKPQKLPPPPPPLPAPPQRTAPSALARTREKEARVSRTHRLSSPQRDRVLRVHEDADTTRAYDGEDGGHDLWSEAWSGAEMNSQRSGICPVPRPTDYYDGTRGLGARTEPLEDLSRVLDSASRRQRQPASATADVEEAKPRRQASAAAQTSAAGRAHGAVALVEGSQTPPRTHEARRSKIGLAGATPWPAQKARPDGEAEERDAAAAAAAAAVTPHAPAQSRPDSTSRRPPMPTDVDHDVSAVSPPRQELRMNRFARYVAQPPAQPSQNSSATRHRSGLTPPVHVSPVRILPETSPYRGRTSQNRTSPSPMRQPSWRGASEPSSVPRHVEDDPAVRVPPRIVEGIDEGFYVDNYPSSGPHPKQMDEDSHSVTSTTNASARQYRPHGSRRPSARASAPQAAKTTQPPPPAPPARTGVSAWTAGAVTGRTQAQAPAHTTITTAAAAARPRPLSSAASDASSIASSLREMKRQTRPSWRRLAPFFPNLSFDGKSDAQIVREMEDELRVLSSPPKAPPRVVPRSQAHAEAHAEAPVPAPQLGSSRAPPTPTPVPSEGRPAKARMTPLSDVIAASQLRDEGPHNDSHHHHRGDSGARPLTSVTAQPSKTELSTCTHDTAPNDETTHRYEVGSGSMATSGKTTSTAKKSSVAPSQKPPAQAPTLHASERASPLPVSVHSAHAAAPTTTTSAESDTPMRSAPSSVDDDAVLPPLHTEVVEPARPVAAPPILTSTAPIANAPRPVTGPVVPVMAVKPIALDRLQARQTSSRDEMGDHDGSSPRTALVASGKSSPRFFAPRSRTSSLANRSVGSPASPVPPGSFGARHPRSSTRSTPTLASLRPSSQVATAVLPVVPSMNVTALTTKAAVPEVPHSPQTARPQWMCGDAVEAALLDAYMQLCDLESQYFRIDMETHEEIEDRVHMVELNEYDRVTGAPRRYLAKGTDQEILPMLRYPETETLPVYSLSREGFLNLCAGMWLTRFQSWQGIHDLTEEMSWTCSTPSTSFSLLRQSYGDMGQPSTPGGIIADEARVADMWVPDFNRPSELPEQVDNVINWAVRTWVEQQVQTGAGSGHGSPLARTPSDAAALASMGDSAMARARRRGPPSNTGATTSAAAALHARSSSLPSDAALQSTNSDVRRDPLALFCARELTDVSLHLGCWPDGIWTSASSPSLVEHATHFLLASLAPQFAAERAKAIAAASADTAEAVGAAQRTWNLFLGAAQWNSDDTMPEAFATMPTKAARVAYAFVSRARTYNLTGGVGALFYSFLTNQLPETAFFDSMFLLEKLRLALLYSPLHHHNARALSTSSRLERMYSLDSARGGEIAVTEVDDDDDSAGGRSGTPMLYDVSLSLLHFFPNKAPAALLTVYEALTQDLQALGKLSHLEAVVSARAAAAATAPAHKSDDNSNSNKNKKKASTELVGEWEELGTEASLSRADAVREPAAPSHACAVPSPHHTSDSDKNETDKLGDGDEVPTLASEGARAMLWAASLYASAKIVLPISRASTPAVLDLDALGASADARPFHSPLLAEADVVELLATIVPVDALFRYQMEETGPLLTSPTRGVRVTSPTDVPDENKEAALLYKPPAGCKSHLVETVRLQYVCELLQYTTDMQEAILSAKRYESPAATARLVRQQADLRTRARAEEPQEDGVVMGSRTESSAGGESDSDVSISIDNDEDDETEINRSDNVTSVRAVLLALQRADPCKPEAEVQNYLRHLLVLYYSGHTLEDLFVDEEEPSEVQLAVSTAADLSLHHWFTPTVRDTEEQRGVATAMCDKVFVHIQELAGLCPRVLARRTSILDDPFAIEL